MVYKSAEQSMVHIRLSPWMYQHITQIADRLGMTLSDVIRMGINEIIKKEGSTTAALSPLHTPASVDPYKRRSYTKIKDTDRSQFEQRLKEMLTEQNIEEWVAQAIKTIQKEIEILQAKIQEYKQKGKTKEVERLERELTKLQQSLSDRAESYVEKGKPLPTGTLHLGTEEASSKKSKKKKKQSHL